MEQRPDGARPSPGFARAAEELLRAGKVQEAQETALAGMKAFPWYATGAMVLGRCYDAQGRKVEAMLEYRRALRKLPENPLLQKLLEVAEEHQREEFEAFTETRTRDLHIRRDSMSFEAYAAEEPAAGTESTVEFLLKQLQGAGRLAPPAADQPAPEMPVIETEPSGKIVTATLAEIYASQGQYGEAIKAYRVLMEQRPDDGPRYAHRLAELEDLARSAKVPNGG